MGVFWYPLEIASARDGSLHSVRALVDTGSLYTWAPKAPLDELGLQPVGRMPFQMADGTTIEREITEAQVKLDGTVRHTIVVFGDPSDQVLLGAYTLEGFALCADPVNKRLVPMQLIPAVSVNPTQP